MTDPDAHVHVELIAHGDLDKLSTAELLALRRVIRSTERHLRRVKRREARGFWPRLGVSYVRLAWFGWLPAYGLLVWSHTFWVQAAVPAAQWPGTQIAWMILRDRWWPF